MTKLKLALFTLTLGYFTMANNAYATNLEIGGGINADDSVGALNARVGIWGLTESTPILLRLNGMYSDPRNQNWEGNLGYIVDNEGGVRQYLFVAAGMIKDVSSTCGDFGLGRCTNSQTEQTYVGPMYGINLHGVFLEAGVVHRQGSKATQTSPGLGDMFDSSFTGSSSNKSLDGFSFRVNVGAAIRL